MFNIFQFSILLLASYYCLMKYFIYLIHVTKLIFQIPGVYSKNCSRKHIYIAMLFIHRGHIEVRNVM